MDPYRLDQTLFVAPGTAFSELDAALRALGWQRNEKIAPSTAPLVPGEPEVAGWRWPRGTTAGAAGTAGKPFVTYTFNPVVRLRVLDVALVPPRLRALVAERLPLVAPEAVESLLAAADPRERLRGLWTAGESERVDLQVAVQKLAKDREPVVAKAAAEVAARLARAVEARVVVLTQMRVLGEAAAPLLRRLHDPAVVAGLRPSREACGRLFDPSIASAVHDVFEPLWQRPPTATPGPDYPELKVTAAPAALLRAPNELSHHFPRGYRDVAGWLEPTSIWLTWAWEKRGGGAVRYDGLVWQDDRWVWLPKVFHVVQALIAERAGAGKGESIS